jgi:hypothetical protein
VAGVLVAEQEEETEAEKELDNQEVEENQIKNNKEIK